MSRSPQPEIATSKQIIYKIGKAIGTKKNSTKFFLLVSEDSSRLGAKNFAQIRHAIKEQNPTKTVVQNPTSYVIKTPFRNVSLNIKNERVQIKTS